MYNLELDNYVIIATLNMPETRGLVIRVSKVDSNRPEREAQWAPSKYANQHIMSGSKLH